MRKVFLDDLPRWSKGEGTGNIGDINWAKSIGCKIKFVYDDIKGTVEIIRYDGKYLIIKYLDKEPYKINTGNFSKCQLGKLLEKKTNKFKLEIGQILKDNKRDLTIIDRKYSKNKNNETIKTYRYKCNICGWNEGLTQENNLKEGKGCACCCGNVIVLGINTIWDTDRWMVDLGVSEEDAKKYTRSSNKAVEVLCSDCDNKKKMIISDIYRYKSICCSCGDGISYPEKIMTNILNQLNINFISQLSKSTFSWCNKYRYDFYLPDYNIIIETHGEQHYKSVKSWNNNVEKIQDNDKLKRANAMNNGIKGYIELNCSKSELEFIKKSILDSQISNIFNLSAIDWNKCEEFALKNIVKEVCEYWNNKEECETAQTIADSNKWGIKSRGCITTYIKIGVKHGWCEYNSKDEMKKNGSRVGGHNKKNVEIFKDEISLGVFKSCVDLERQSEERFGVKLFNPNISKVCNGKASHHKGYFFKYV